jgi:hypothetical protein
MSTKSPEHRAKLSAALKGKKLSNAHRKNISEGIKRDNALRTTPRFCRPRTEDEKRRMSESMKGRTYTNEHREKISKNNGMKLKKLRGETMPNYNPLWREFRAYSRVVKYFTEENYRLHKNTINPMNHPRSVSGTEGGYQLDHRISKKRGFLMNINPKVIADYRNLQMLPWRENIMKGAK